MKKKLLTAVVLTLCAVALVAGSVFATIAFLADFSAVSNTFTVGSVGIDMKETKVDENGIAIADAPKVDGNSYHLIPNKTYKKDPTIYIDKTEAKDMMYLFVKSNNQIRAVEEGNILDKDGNPVATENKTMRQQMEANGWVEFIQSGDGVEIIWVYGTRNEDTGVITPTAVNCDSKQFNTEGCPAGEFRLCENFTIGNVDSNKLGFYGGLTVTFTGFAIQTSQVPEAGNELVLTSWNSIKHTFPVNCAIANPVNPYNNEWTEEKAYLPVAKNQTSDPAAN